MNLENKYLQIMHYKIKDIPTIVPLLLFIKSDFLNNEFFFFVAILFRFFGLLIICGNYSNGVTVNREHLTISILFRAISCYGLSEQLRISNLTYIIFNKRRKFIQLLLEDDVVKAIVAIRNKSIKDKETINLLDKEQLGVVKKSNIEMANVFLGKKD